MTELEYDPSPIFDVIPSLFRDSHENRAVLETLYRGWLRAIDNDYAQLFTLNDNKDLTTLRPTTLQPLVYRNLTEWLPTGAKHAHRKFTAAWPAPSSGKYDLFFADVVLSQDIQLFLDRDLIPSFVYSVKYHEQLVSGSVVAGTKVTVDKDKLNKYLIGEFLGEAYGSYVANPLYATANPEEDYTTVTVYVHGYREVKEIAGDGAVSTFEIDSTISLPESKIYISRLDISPQTYVRGANVYLGRSYPAGSKFFVHAKGSTQEFKQIVILTAATDYINASFTDVDAAPVVVQYFIDYEIKPLTIVQGTISSTVRFKPNTQVRVHTRKGIQTKEITSATTDIKVSGVTPDDILAVVYCGVNIFNVVKTTDKIKFGRAVNPGTTLRLEANITEQHAHRQVVASITGSVTSVTTSSDDFEFYPEMVFVNGSLMLEDDDYTLSNGVITFTTPLVADDVLEMNLVVPGVTDHAHRLFRIVPETEEYVLSYNFDLGKHPAQVFNNGRLVSKQEYKLVNKTIVFNDALTIKSPYSVYLIEDTLPYQVTIPPVEEPLYRYKAQIDTCELLQNGVERPTVVLDNTQFKITAASNRHITLCASTPIEHCYFINAYIDEDNLQNTWGHLVNYIRPSSSRYAKELSAILLSLRTGSTPWIIENVGSILLGSDFVSRDSTLGENTPTTVTVHPIDGSDPVVLSRIEEADFMLESGTLPRFTAVNKLITVEDGDISHPWIALFAEELSDTFKASRRLDAFDLTVLTGIPASYDSVILRDYSVNFIESGVRVGDLVRGDFGVREGEGLVDTEDLTIRYARVTQVVDLHSIKVDFNIAPTGTTSYGEDAYGDGLYGGSSTSSLELVYYTVWCRNLHRLDMKRRLDIRDLRELTLELMPIFSAHAFIVRIAWLALKDSANLDGLAAFLEKAKPAETKCFVFTEAFKTSGRTDLRDSCIAAVMEDPPSQSKAVNIYAPEEAFLGLSEVLTLPSDYIFTTACIGEDSTDFYLDFEV